MDRYQLTQEEKLRFELRSLYRAHGYRPFRMSKFEKYELYAGYKDFLVSDRVITFQDTNGELMALKPDVTLSIVKNARYTPGEKEKYCYHETVYRPTGSAGLFGEILQSGLECIGDLDVGDEHEVLCLADRTLAAISVESVLSFSHLGILHSLIGLLQPESGTRSRLLALVANRNAHELKALFLENGWDLRLLEDIRELLSLDCEICEMESILAKYAWVSKEVIREFSGLKALFGESCPRIRFDFSVMNDTRYYNGIVFQGYVRGVAEKILSGGRYDALLTRMGKQGGAIGFALYMSLIESFFLSGEGEKDA
ncbi:MAG: ATP phosphoribosyltransferase regulatory subunit [Oscillospiraceae bacterium]|nr:ATP phosphoribosyltransferase regulatory subunit [Oscillospiraceae bacterium]